MLKQYLVIDHCIPAFLGDRILDPEYATRFPGATVLSSLVRLARERGWKVHTADVFLAEVKTFERAVCLSNEFTPLLQRLMQKGVKPGLLISGESPNVARQFYRDLPHGSLPFVHACLFRGSLQRLALNCQGHTFLWPCPARILETNKPWAQRSLLGMVASYKRAWSRLRALPMELLFRLSWQTSQWREQSLQLQDLYNFRIKLARLFGLFEEFHLHGHGWENIVKGKKRWWRRRLRFAHVPTACLDKLVALGESRFSLILENCVYPGYVTEKIFDGFRAGTVPVYLGAPDIEEFVPPDCFIDYRKFANPDVLWNELSSMSEVRWNQYRKAITEFMASPQYHRHLEENVARQWLDWLEDAVEQA